MCFTVHIHYLWFVPFAAIFRFGENILPQLSSILFKHVEKFIHSAFVRFRSLGYVCVCVVLRYLRFFFLLASFLLLFHQSFSFIFVHKSLTLISHKKLSKISIKIYVTIFLRLQINFGAFKNDIFHVDAELNNFMSIRGIFPVNSHTRLLCCSSDPPFLFYDDECECSVAHSFSLFDCVRMRLTQWEWAGNVNTNR